MLPSQKILRFNHINQFSVRYSILSKCLNFKNVLILTSLISRFNHINEFSVRHSILSKFLNFKNVLRLKTKLVLTSLV